MTLCSSLLAAGRPVALGSFPPFPKQKGQGQHPAGLLLTSHRAHKSSARVGGWWSLTCKVLHRVVVSFDSSLQSPSTREKGFP
jgi:hypothetical protein